MGLTKFIASAAPIIGAAAGTAVGNPMLGASLGGMLGKAAGAKIQKKENWNNYQRNVDRENYLSNIGYDRQKEFASNAIQWKVKDAKAAGINPLVALGANTMSYSPQAIGGGTEMQSQMGQDLSRSALQTATNTQRAATQLNLENMDLKNDLLRTEIASAKARLTSQISPGGMPDVQEMPLKKIKAHKNAQNQEVGYLSDTGYAKTPTGLAPVPSADVTERIEDKLLYEAPHAYRNLIKPIWSKANKPQKKYLPKGFNDWQWSVRNMEWQPVRGKGRTPINRLKKWWNKNVTDWQR